MGKRGQKPLEERIGIEKFKELLKRLGVPEIAKLYGESIRTVYRAKGRMEEKEKTEKRFDPIDQFEAIPEVQSFKSFMEAKKVKYRKHINMLRRIWSWIREAKDENGNPVLSLIETQRPALWDIAHVEFALKKLHEMQVSVYHWKQALRRFFESQGQLSMLKNPLLQASAKDMRSPNGKKRMVMSFTTQETPQILACVEGDIRTLIKMQITAKSREQSLLNTEWDAVNWNDEYYGFPMATITIYETKTNGGTYWEHCPLDLWFGDLSKELREKWEREGRPEKGKIINIDYDSYCMAWRRISARLGRKIEAHDCRRSVGGWLRDLGLSELALGQYDPIMGTAVGYTGVGWENANIYYQRYGKKNPLGIYDKEKRLDITVFDGLIHKIVENNH